MPEIGSAQVVGGVAWFLKGSRMPTSETAVNDGGRESFNLQK